jgi:hypothetical protein
MGIKEEEEEDDIITEEEKADIMEKLLDQNSVVSHPKPYRTMKKSRSYRSIHEELAL